jgi:plasmid stabilization system protein ParE
MSDPLTVEITALAASHIRTAEEWWRRNRPAAPNAVRQELERAFALIAGQPRIGSRATNVKLPGVRRIYLPVIKQFLYFHVIAAPERVEVVALWHARRETGPPI